METTPSSVLGLQDVDGGERRKFDTLWGSRGQQVTKFQLNSHRFESGIQEYLQRGRKTKKRRAMQRTPSFYCSEAPRDDNLRDFTGSNCFGNMWFREAMTLSGDRW